MPGVNANKEAALADHMGIKNEYNLPEAGKNLPPDTKPAQGAGETHRGGSVRRGAAGALVHDRAHESGAYGLAGGGTQREGRFQISWLAFRPGQG